MSYKKGAGGQEGPLFIVCQLGQPPHLAHLPARCADASFPSPAPPAGPGLSPCGHRGELQVGGAGSGPWGLELSTSPPSWLWKRPPQATRGWADSVPHFYLCWIHKDLSELLLGPGPTWLCISVSGAHGSGFWAPPPPGRLYGRVLTAFCPVRVSSRVAISDPLKAPPVPPLSQASVLG